MSKKQYKLNELSDNARTFAIYTKLKHMVKATDIRFHGYHPSQAFKILHYYINYLENDKIRFKGMLFDEFGNLIIQ